MHDVVGQALTAARLQLAALLPLPGSVGEGEEAGVAFGSPSHGGIADAISSLDAALSLVRGFALELRPALLDDLGLVAALHDYTRRHGAAGGFATQLLADRLDDPIPAEIETACFRIAQEAITNVVRHARATWVAVRLRRRAQELVLEIIDDGIGFDVSSLDAPGDAASALGLLGMHERAALFGGLLTIQSRPGHGTTVRARFPVPRARSSVRQLRATSP